MNTMQEASLFTVSMTLLLAFLATLAPLPPVLVKWWPCWVLMVMIHWQIYTTRYCGMFTAFGMGLLMDLALGTLLGEHALALVVSSYGVLKFQRAIRLSPLVARVILIFFISLAYCTILLMCAIAKGFVHGQWWYWFPAVFTALLWPILSQILSLFTRTETAIPMHRM